MESLDKVAKKPLAFKSAETCFSFSESDKDEIALLFGKFRLVKARNMLVRDSVYLHHLNLS